MTTNNDSFTVLPYPRTRLLMVDGGRLGRRKHTIHGLVEFDITQARDALRRHRAATGAALSFSAFFLACLGKAIDADRQMHAYRDWRNRLILFDDVDVNMLFEVDVKEEQIEDPLPTRDEWWEEAWTPTPLPAAPTTPKLILVVSTAPLDDVVDCVQRYKRRWPAQENIIRDFLLPLGLDHNHGYQKRAVENSEISKRRQALQQQLDNVLRWRTKACQRRDRAGRLYHRRYDQAKARSRALYRDLNIDQIELAFFDLPQHLVKRYLKAKQTRFDAELDLLWKGVRRALDNNYREGAKVKGYALKARQLLRQLEDLNTQARQMYELDNRKDQIMTSLRLALTNLVMWVRVHCFPDNYAQATWKRLVPFFRLPGHIVDDPDRRLVFPRPFNDRQLNRDLDAFCERVNQAQWRLPDGRLLKFLRYKSLTLISDTPT